MQLQVYPWRRYWARLFDITFIMPIYIFIIALFSPGLSYGIPRMDSFIGSILLLLFYLCKWQIKMHLARKTILHLPERKKWFNPPLLFEF